MYKKVEQGFDFSKRETEQLSFWAENQIFKKSIALRSDESCFTFYDGPPTANGRPHIGHILTRAIKDLIPRYKTMKGYKVLRKAGWDTHGLPVELEVEKLLGINGKPAIEEYGIEPFIEKCKESVWKYKSEWERMSDRVGFFADMESPYITYDNSYIESIWWALKQIWDKDLLYKGYKVMPYCPRCGTSLSSHEVAQGYKDVSENSIFVKFKVKNEVDTYILAWTTTPWTLPSNVALAVSPNEVYVLIEQNGEKIYMAKALVDKVVECDYKVLREFKGSELEYLEYVPLFDFARENKKAFYVCVANFVTLAEGTGVVHMAPAFGEDDAKIAREYDLPFIQFVNPQGKLTKEAYLFEGMFVKDADPHIISTLKDQGLLYKEKIIEHSYPFCWRCDTPLLYFAMDTWFIKMTKVKENLIKNNNKINWYPDNIRTGRFGKFIDNVVDWGLSRSRYWGTPLPIWECQCGVRHLIGSIEELCKMSVECDTSIELHKPYIDEIKIICPSCGKHMIRVPEVIDCWFDSGAMPFAQWHYPFENETIFNENFPADFISEAVDQTRGWFYTLLAISTLLFDEPAFKNVLVLGHVCDKTGAKMSKHKGNVVDPWDALDKFGADAVRWYFYTGSAPWLPIRFYEDAVLDGQKRFIGTLRNTYAFYVLYANIDGFDPSKYNLSYSKLPQMDRWILSKLNSLIKLVDEGLTEYKITEAARAISDFTEELSNWYVRRCRDRFWQGGIEQDKINAYMTLNEVLITLAHLCAPFTPFIAEELYQNLVVSVYADAKESVHLSDYPCWNDKYIDLKLEEDMRRVLKIVNMGRNARNTAKIKNRQPLGELLVCDAYGSLSKEYIDLIKDELNIKEMRYIDDVSEFETYSFKPQLRTLGKKYGKLVPKIAEFLKNVDGRVLMNTFKTEDVACVDLDGNEVILTIDDVIYETAQVLGYQGEQDQSTSVILCTKLTPTLIEEGYVRELVSKIQTMRKEAGFEVMDNISIGYNGTSIIEEVLVLNDAKIMKETLAISISNSCDEKGYSKEWNVNDESVKLSVTKM